MVVSTRPIEPGTSPTAIVRLRIRSSGTRSGGVNPRDVLRARDSVRRHLGTATVRVTPHEGQTRMSARKFPQPVDNLSLEAPIRHPACGQRVESEPVRGYRRPTEVRVSTASERLSMPVDVRKRSM